MTALCYFKAATHLQCQRYAAMASVHVASEQLECLKQQHQFWHHKRSIHVFMYAYTTLPGRIKTSVAVSRLLVLIGLSIVGAHANPLDDLLRHVVCLVGAGLHCTGHQTWLVVDLQGSKILYEKY